MRSSFKPLSRSRVDAIARNLELLSGMQLVTEKNISSKSPGRERPAKVETRARCRKLKHGKIFKILLDFSGQRNITFCFKV
jgi:hypothetical protein